jgi:hypothetical protein
MFHIASRMRLGALIALPAVAAVMTFAPSADAAVYTPTNGAQLTADITAANAAGGSNEIILAPAVAYFPTTPMVVTPGDYLEITGPPQNPAINQSHGTFISGGDVVPSASNTFTVEPGAYAIFKGFGTEALSTMGFSGFLVEGKAEFDNMEIQAFGNAIQAESTTQTANVYVNDSAVVDGSEVGVLSDSVSNTILNSDTIADNNGGGIDGSAILNNTLVANNAGPSQGNYDCDTYAYQDGTITAYNSIDDDGSCAAADTTGTGVTTDTLTSLHLGRTTYNGGPTATEAIPTTSAAYGVGSGCLPVDQRFITFTGPCSVGSFQPSSSTVADATAPVCTVVSKNESTNPSVASTEVVGASDAGSGIGPDAVSGATTTNGSVGWPVIAGTPYDETTPSNALGLFDLPTTSAFPVTATKPVGDLTVGDTKWSFTATSWADISTYCN